MEKVFITFHKRGHLNSFLRGHKADKHIIIGCADIDQANAIIGDLREDNLVSYIRLNHCGRVRKGYTYYSANEYLNSNI